MTRCLVLAFVGACHEHDDTPPPTPSAAPPAIAALDATDAALLIDAAADAAVAIRPGRPTPEAVCDHLFALATASEGASGAMLALGTRETCIEHERREHQVDGVGTCRNDVCSMRATTWAEAKRCMTRSAQEQDPTGICAPRY